MSFYNLTNITPLDKITSKDYKALQIAIVQAEKSNFDSSRRLGACLVFKGQCILWGKPT